MSTGCSIIYDTSPNPTPQEYDQINQGSVGVPAELPKNVPSTTVYINTPNINTPNINTQESRNFPLEVRKWVLEGSKDGYLVNESIWIMVDINTIGDLWPEDIELLEVADKNLNIMCYPGYYITNCINDTISFNKLYNHAHGLNYKNNTIYIRVPGLEPKQHLLYKYCIRPNKTGVFNAQTILRFGTAESFKAETVLKTKKVESFFPDSYYPLEIPVMQPDFDIKIGLDKTEVVPEKDINLTYLITYKSRNGNLSENHTFMAQIGTLMKNNKVIAKPNQFKLYFKKDINDNTYMKNITAKFKEQGTYNIPEITINNITYIPSGQIKVQSFWDKYVLEITLFLTVFALLTHPFVVINHKKPNCESLLRVWLVFWILLFVIFLCCLSISSS